MPPSTLSQTEPHQLAPHLFATFGPVHLDVIRRERSLGFWRDLVGLRLIAEDEQTVELGTERDTLVVLHDGATAPAPQGHSGLHHFALHLPDEPEFARALARMIASEWPTGTADHTQGKSLYLNDPDGIGLELTVETPDRGQVRVVDGWVEAVDQHGQRRSGSAPLDIDEVLAKLPDGDLLRPLPAGTKVGHLHFHVGNVERALGFYRDSLGFFEGNVAPAMRFADLHTGGQFKHQIALNTWQGAGVVKPPAGTVGLRRYAVRYDSPARLQDVLRRVDVIGETDGAAVIHDPDGNVIWLT